MTAPTGSRDDRLEHAARRAHHAALRAVPPRTLAQLRPRTAASATPAMRWHPAWALATAGAAVFAAALGLRMLAGPAAPAPAPATAPIAVATPALPRINDPLVVLEEDPDLFLWLASTDARPLAME